MTRVRLSAVLLALLVPAAARAQAVTLPAEVRGDAGAWVVVVPDKKDGGEVKWKVGPGLSVVPIDKLFPGQKAAGVVVQGPRGRYEVWAWCAKGDVASELAVCTVVLGDAPPTPPTPPGPVPPTPPGPVQGLKVLIVYESSERAALTGAQENILSGKPMRDWLVAHCSPDPAYPKGFAIWDKDVETAGMPKHWQDALARPRGGVPWVVVMDGNGAAVDGFALPANADALIAALSKYVPAKLKKAG